MNMTIIFDGILLVTTFRSLCKEKQRVLLKKKKSFLARKRSGFTLFMITLCTYLATHLPGYSLLTKMLLADSSKLQRHVGFKMELCGERNLYPQSHMPA